MENYGGAGDDNLDGGEGVDFLFGGSGDDTLTGGGSRDYLLGGGGADAIYGGEGDDIILGDAGDDIIDAGADDDTIIDEGGDDTLTGGTGEDTFAFLPGHGSDTITDFNTSDDQIDLSQFTMAITFTQLQAKMSTVTNDANVVTGVQIDLSDFGGGTITLEGITATSDLTAEMFCLPDCDSPLDDILVESPVTGDENRNFYLGDTGGATYTTLGGNDIVFAEEGDDTIYGGEGDDWLVGGEGADTIEGGADADTIYGGEGDDWLVGGEGADTIEGGADADDIEGGEGADTITGGTGCDGLRLFDVTRIVAVANCGGGVNRVPSE